MSKTFKSSSGTGRTVEIEPNFGSVNMVIYKCPSRANKYLGINIAITDAPALALAIIEAAGVNPVQHESCSEASPEALEHVAHWLADHIECVAKKAKEAADREALEGLARKLYNADRSACDLIWEDLTPGVKKRWVDRMNKASEIIEAQS